MEQLRDIVGLLEKKEVIIDDLAIKVKDAKKLVDFCRNKLQETEDYAGESHQLPDFGFIEDVYIPGHILKKAGIAEITKAKAKAVLNRGEWQVIEIEVL